MLNVYLTCMLHGFNFWKGTFLEILGIINIGKKKSYLSVS